MAWQRTGWLGLLLVAWSVLNGVLGLRWKGRVQEDERDHRIAQHAAGWGWGRGAVTCCLVGPAMMLTFSPAERLAWATHLMIATLLVFALMWGAVRLRGHRADVPEGQAGDAGVNGGEASARVSPPHGGDRL